MVSLGHWDCIRNHRCGYLLDCFMVLCVIHPAKMKANTLQWTLKQMRNWTHFRSLCVQLQGCLLTGSVISACLGFFFLCVLSTAASSICLLACSRGWLLCIRCCQQSLSSSERINCPQGMSQENESIGFTCVFPKSKRLLRAVEELVIFAFRREAQRSLLVWLF